MTSLAAEGLRGLIDQGTQRLGMFDKALGSFGLSLRGISQRMGLASLTFTFFNTTLLTGITHTGEMGQAFGAMSASIGEGIRPIRGWVDTLGDAIKQMPEWLRLIGTAALAFTGLNLALKTLIGTGLLGLVAKGFTAVGLSVGWATFLNPVALAITATLALQAAMYLLYTRVGAVREAFHTLFASDLFLNLLSFAIDNRGIVGALPGGLVPRGALEALGQSSGFQQGLAELKAMTQDQRLQLFNRQTANVGGWDSLTPNERRLLDRFLVGGYTASPDQTDTRGNTYNFYGTTGEEELRRFQESPQYQRALNNGG